MTKKGCFIPNEVLTASKFIVFFQQHSNSTIVQLGNSFTYLKFNASHIVYFLGLVGAVLFFSFRPSVDYFSEAPLDLNRKDIENKINALSSNLGIQLDTLSAITSLQQHTKYAEDQMDSSPYPNPKYLIKKIWCQVVGMQSMLLNRHIIPYQSMLMNSLHHWDLFGFGSMVRLI